MVDFGRRPGDMFKSVYDQDDDGVADGAEAHKTTHQNDGDDEITVEGLAGELTAAQPSTWEKVAGKPSSFTPAAHKTGHQDGGADEISLAGLSGEAADAQPSTWAKVSGKPSTFTPAAHKASHQDGGTDEIDVTGLVGATGSGILGDGTAGRVYRSLDLAIRNGTDNNTLKVTVTDRWNGDAIAEQDNIAKNATTGHFTLDANGQKLIVECAGLSGNVLEAHGILTENSSETHLLVNMHAYQNDLRVFFMDQAGGLTKDLTQLVDQGTIQVRTMYITDA